MNNLPGIVKVRKTSYYTQIHSHPIQNDLEDLRSIGLMSYVLSMDENFVLYKSFLFSKFTRRSVESAIKELTEKNYWFSLKLHHKGKIVYSHYVSDVVFSEEQITEEVQSINAKFLGVSCGYPELESQLLKMYNSQKDCCDSVSSVVQNVQHNLYCTNCTSNYNQLNNNQLNNNQLKDIKDVNNVSTVSVSKDAQRIESLKAKWCHRGISPDWIEKIYKQSIEHGIANKIAYCNKAAGTYLDNMQKKSTPVTSNRTEIVPDWFDERNQKKDQSVNTIDFEAERKKVIDKLNSVN
ncbi:hypothetical protein [Lysinibacillus sphaericus]|uniref:hypothetical protein n=1 Tax=Lysinibacillus sphaericus TaxID=1421 RepID=UPI003D082CE8